MRAVTVQRAKLELTELADPRPASGQVVLDVLGRGPVGLAVIAMLKARGIATVVASDFSAGRRELAAAGRHAKFIIEPASSAGAPS